MKSKSHCCFNFKLLLKANRVQLATILAAVLSSGALLLCFVMSTLIFAEVQTVWSELDGEMESFKVEHVYISLILDVSFNFIPVDFK